MNRILSFVLILILALSLSACGAEDSSPPENRAPTDPAQQEMLKKALEKWGIVIEFQEDGSLTPEAKDNIAALWLYDDSDDRSAPVGSGEWPDNDLTRLVPKPDFPVFDVHSEDERIMILFGDGITPEDVQAYAEELRAAGFDREVEISDIVRQSMVTFTYSAENEQGSRAVLFYDNGIVSLDIEN